MRINTEINAHPCKKYPDYRSLFDGLQRLETDAIRCLQEKSRGAIFSYGKMRTLGDHDLEEVLEDATVLFLEKIGSGAYEFQGMTPVTYHVEIGKRLVLKKGERRKPKSVEIDSAPIVGEDEISDFYEQKALEETVAKMLSKLGDHCREVIRLRYFERLTDAEVIEKKLMHYSSVGSLKVKRSECMGKLTEMVGDKKHLFFE